MGIEVDGANQKLILDSDGDTYLEAATDDTIKVYVSGAHDATISANAINILSGTTLTIDSGATITNSGTANGFGSNEPSSADGQALGSTSAEWSDLYLADGGVVYFGNDQDINITHVADTGLTTNGTITANAGLKADNITIDGTEIDLSSGDLTLDVAGDIYLNADGGDIVFQDGSATTGKISYSGGNMDISSDGSDNDIVFKGDDGGSAITALTLDMSDAGAALFNSRILTNADGDGTTCAISSSNDVNTGINFRPGSNADQIDVLTGGTTRLRIRDNGAICSERGAGHSSNSTLQQASDQGMLIRDGDESIYASSSGAFSFNRSNNNTNDLTLINFFRNGSNPGNITGTDSSISYNTFIGSHWSQFSDNSKPTILIGTIIESIDEICDWPMVKFTIPANKSPTGKDKEMREYISKPYTVGANIKHTFDGVEYDGVVELEIQKEHLPKCKISDTEDSTSVYGIFREWDENDKVNDLSVAALGAFVVRVHKDETVAKGNLLSSKGDGTAKVQSDGNFKNTTIAKVTSATKIETYSDGSYTVPCTLHCG